MQAPHASVDLCGAAAPATMPLMADREEERVLAVLSVAMPVFLLILIGGIAGRHGFLGRDATGALNMFVVYLSLPAVLFQAMAHIRPAELTNPGLLAAFGAGIAASFVPALAIARRRGTPLAQCGDAGAQRLILQHRLYGYPAVSHGIWR